MTNPDNLIAGLEKIDEGMRLLSRGPLSFYTSEMAEMVKAMFARFCPWKAGDRVELTMTPEISRESGWYQSRHFLIAGAKGTVQEVDFTDGLFYAAIIFDDESWLKDGIPQPIKEKGMYSFSEKMADKTATATYHPETRLLILRNGTERTIYAVEDVRPCREVANPAFKLTKMRVVLPGEGEKFATLEPTECVYHVALEPHGYSCQCGDYVWRRGQSGQSCKHIRSLIATGLMPHIPHNEDK